MVAIGSAQMAWAPSATVKDARPMPPPTCLPESLSVFMTQFGRYAKIVKKEVKDYRIIQDSIFCPALPARSRHTSIS
jgi:hypothetical protein